MSEWEGSPNTLYPNLLLHSIEINRNTRNFRAITANKIIVSNIISGTFRFDRIRAELAHMRSYLIVSFYIYDNIDRIMYNSEGVLKSGEFLMGFIKIFKLRVVLDSK